MSSKNKSRGKKNSRLSSVSSNSPNIPNLEMVRAESVDKKTFDVLCASRRLTQPEMFHELLLAYKTLENQE